MTPHVILHPTDFSEHSQQALEVAATLAAAHGARLVVLHAVPRLVPVGAGAGPEPFRAEHCEADLRQYRREMRQRLDGLTVADPRVCPESRLAEGDIPAAIVTAARELACDLIVMGVPGGAGELCPRPGGVAEDVFQHAHCPVLLLRSN